MRAVVREGSVRLVHREGVRVPGEVTVAVRRAGICRTDLYVADGMLVVDEPRTLGHEAVGVVIDGDGPFASGTRVAVNPALSCRLLGRDACGFCNTERPCASPVMLGVDRDGAFADTVSVPAAALVPLPQGVGWEIGALAEPVAAALGVLRAPIRPSARGAIFGNGRIADLMTRVLTAAGFTPIPWSPELRGLDWVVEATTAGRALDEAMHSLAPGGTLVLKSRPARPAALDVAYAVRNELILVGRSYGNFTDAVAWLSRLSLGDLVGEVFPLERFEAAFAAARRDERRKIFIAMED